MKRQGIELARSFGFLLLVVPAVLRVLVLVSPNPFFTFNPLEIALPVEGLGPSGSLALDALSWLGFLLVLVTEIFDRHSLHWRLVLLALIPIIATTFHVLAWPTPAVPLDSEIAQQITDAQNELRQSKSIGWSTIKHPENLILGSAWGAAMMTAIGAMLLSRRRHYRLLLIGAVVALVAPLSVKAVYQVTVEFQETVAGFEQTKESVFRANGWAVDSIQARLYERRLRQPEATGWFGLSNVFGTFGVMLSVFWMGVMLAAARTKLSSGWIGLLALITAAAMAALALTFSKGAMASGVIGIILVLGVILPRRARRRIIPKTAWITIALVLLTLIAVILRGFVFGERFTADGFSLLFRWHYWIGAWRMLIDHPLLGVGPEGFKAAYVIVKPLMSPEEVASPHSIFVSWVSCLGLLALPWVALIFIMIDRIAPRRRSESSGEDADPTSSQVASGSQQNESDLAPNLENTRAHWVMSAIIGVAALGSGWWLNRASSFPDFAYVLWPLATMGYVALIGVLPWIGVQSSWALLRWTLWSAVTVVLVHSQIEMSMTRIGSASILMLFIGASVVFDSSGSIGGRSESKESASNDPVTRFRTLVPVTALAGLVGLFIVFHTFVLAIPTWRSQSALQSAALQLGEVGRLRQMLNTEIANARDLPAFQRAVESLALELTELNADPNVSGRMRELQAAARSGDNPRARTLQQSIWLDLDFNIKKVELLQIGGDPNDSADLNLPSALASLEQAATHMPFDPIPWEEQIKLWVILARAHADARDFERARQAIDMATTLNDRLIALRPERASSYAGAATLRVERSRLLNAPGAKEDAVTMLATALTLDPHNLPLSLRLADLLADLQRNEDAVVAYRRVLQINDQVRLDPLKGLTDDQISQTQRRIESLENQ